MVIFELHYFMGGKWEMPTNTDANTNSNQQPKNENEDGKRIKYKYISHYIRNLH